MPVLVLPAPYPPSSGHHALARIDGNGRLTAARLTRALGWAPGLALAITVPMTAAGPIVVIVPAHQPTDHPAARTADRLAPLGVAVAHWVDRGGDLRLPATLRRRLGLATGAAVLLSADPPRQRLVAYPPATLATLLAALDADPPGGDRT